MKLNGSFVALTVAAVLTTAAHAATTAAGTTQKPSSTHTSASTTTSSTTSSSMASTSMTPVKSDIPAALAKEAKVSLEAARKTALAHVKDGTVRSEELEREHGKLLYSFDIAAKGKSGVSEVHVDAMTGKYLSTHHESAATEKKEAKEEKPHAG